MPSTVLYFQIGQVVVTKGCDTKCVCQASGLVRYEKRVCGMKDGFRGCQLKRGHCMVHPGAHFTTFDGMKGFMGLWVFEVASLCDQTSAQWFRMVMDVRVCSNGVYPNVATVCVFKDVTVNSQHNTWVNGQNVSLPSTPAKQLSVSIADRTVVIERDSGVRVTYSISQELFITIDNHLAGKVCGACGNYNGIVKDDMTADRKSSTDVTDRWLLGGLGTSLAVACKECRVHQLYNEGLIFPPESLKKSCISTCLEQS
ncbi:zonadhesin-like [Salvelinus sp. IW2-2015]|uniref:zonadhesin-like n=1 Tax=Salvelinus sp. IW2-2015 TaxID=2691554 RepID=UPI000CDF83C2|nr:IgGFc-binding protein-like [Salvelinus alpinus]